jgi:hypothetical protein
MSFDKKWLVGIVAAITTVVALYRWRGGSESAESEDSDAEPA